MLPAAASVEQTESKLDETLAKQEPLIDAFDDETNMEGEDSSAQADVVDGADRNSDGCYGAILVEDRLRR